MKGNWRYGLLPKESGSSVPDGQTRSWRGGLNTSYFMWKMSSTPFEDGMISFLKVTQLTLKKFIKS